MPEPEWKTAINIFFLPPDLTALFATKDFRIAIIQHEKKEEIRLQHKLRNSHPVT